MAMKDKVEKKERTDNPLTDHSDDVDIVKVEHREEEPEKEKVVSTEPDDDGDDGPTPRQQKRRARYDEIQAERDREKTRAEEAERRALEAEHRAAAVLAYQQMGQRGQKPEDPFEADQKEVEEDWKRHQAMSSTLTNQSPPEAVQRWKDDFFKIQQKMADLSAKRTLHKSGITPGQPINMEAEMERAYINSNFGDVTSNPRARQYAAALVDQKLAESGRMKATLKDYEEAVNTTRRKFNMPGAQSPTPSDATRRKFSGTGLGGASNGASQGRGEIRMNEDMQAMAEAAYSRIRDPNTGKYRKTTREEAHRLWAQGPGKKMLAKTGG